MSNNQLTYSISVGNEDGKFHIDPESGEIYRNQSIDIENEDNLYVLNVTATDNGASPLSSSALVTIDIMVSFDWYDDLVKLHISNWGAIILCAHWQRLVPQIFWTSHLIQVLLKGSITHCNSSRSPWNVFRICFLTLENTESFRTKNLPFRNKKQEMYPHFLVLFVC